MQHVGAQYITSIAFSPDGQRIVSSCRHGSVILWDVQTGALLAPLLGQGAKVWRTMAFSPDGKVLYTHHGKWVYLLDSATGRSLKMLEVQPSWVLCVALSPRGEFLAAGLNDGNIVIWDLPADTATVLSNSSKTPNSDRVQQPTTDNITAAIAQHTSTMAGTGSLPHGWEERDTQKKRRVYYRGHNTQTTTWVGPRRQTIIPLMGPNGQGSSLQLQLETTPQFERSSIKSLVFSRNGSILTSGSDDGTCAVWSVGD
jgi:WD40 repeat protein